MQEMSSASSISVSGPGGTVQTAFGVFGSGKSAGRGVVCNPRMCVIMAVFAASRASSSLMGV